MNDEYLNQLQQLKNNISAKLTVVSDEVRRLEEELADADAAIRTHMRLTGKSIFNEKNNLQEQTIEKKDGFYWDKSRPLKQRAIELIRYNGAFVSTAQLGEQAYAYDKTFTAKQWKEKISDALSKASEELGVATVLLDGTSGSAVRGLREWLDEKEQIKPEYIPKSKT